MNDTVMAFTKFDQFNFLSYTVPRDDHNCQCVRNRCAIISIISLLSPSRTISSWLSSPLLALEPGPAARQADYQLHHNVASVWPDHTWEAAGWVKSADHIVRFQSQNQAQQAQRSARQTMQLMQ